MNNVATFTAKDNYYIDPEASSYAGDGDLAAQFGECTPTRPAVNMVST